MRRAASPNNHYAECPGFIFQHKMPVSARFASSLSVHDFIILLWLSSLCRLKLQMLLHTPPSATTTSPTLGAGWAVWSVINSHAYSCVCDDDVVFVTHCTSTNTSLQLEYGHNPSFSSSYRFNIVKKTWWYTALLKLPPLLPEPPMIPATSTLPSKSTDESVVPSKAVASISHN